MYVCCCVKATSAAEPVKFVFGIKIVMGIENSFMTLTSPPNTIQFIFMYRGYVRASVKIYCTCVASRIIRVNIEYMH